MKFGRSVRLYLAEGTASGVLTAEIMNWTGHLVVGPRTRLYEALQRIELRKTGVYLIYDPNDDGTESTKLYIGEGDEIGKRLVSHDKDEQKLFWERFVAITSKDQNLTKAHVRYLESRLIELASLARKAHLANGTAPTFKKLPEADIADMEGFLAELELVLPVVGVEFFKRPVISKTKQEFAASSSEAPAVKFKFLNASANVIATAMEIDGEFVVLAGSKGAWREAPSFHERIKIARDDALATQRISLVSDQVFMLNDNISFSSPSAASVFLMGTSRNGRTDCLVDGEGITYGAYKDKLLSLASQTDL